ncbi:MAG: hypothetical protein ACLQGP_16405 [Isosphaeraceae bacterium]
MMPSIDGRALAERSGRDSAERPRPSFRIGPRLEVLETRCLLSGTYPGGEYDDGPSSPVRGPVVTEKPVGFRGLDHHGVRQPVTSGGHESGSPPSVGHGSAGARVGGSWSDGTTLPGIPGLPRAYYVIVPETSAPHQTFATAQGLPDLPYFGVVGTIGSGDPADLYRLTLNAGAEGLNFGLVSDQSGAMVPMQLQAFDGAGHLLGEWSFGSQGTTSLSASLGALTAGSTIYFGITAGNPGGAGGSSAPIGYQLWVGLQSATAGSTIAPGAGTTGSSPANSPAIASPIPASTGASAFPPSGNSPGTPNTPSSPPNASVGMRVAVGAPATRSAGPSGGLLSEGDPAPAVASDFNAAVNKAWDESSLNGPTARTANTVDPTDLSLREGGPDALVIVHGPGGFPLLGAVALGHRRGNSTADMGDPESPADGSYEDFQAESRALPAVSASAIPSTDGSSTARSRAFRDRAWGRFSVPFFSGLGLATVFTLNAVLSQPIAGFDYLTSRLDSDDRTQPLRKNRLIGGV